MSKSLTLRTSETHIEEKGRTLMSTHEIPEVKFEERRGQPIFPRPDPKHAVLIPIPELVNSEVDLPTTIRPEWGGAQVFYGDYYGIVRDGAIVYGSAKEQWEAMHSQIKPGYWVKTGIPVAYIADRQCRIITLIPDASGSIKEASYVLQPGDWIVRQPGGEIQHIKAEKYTSLYFSAAEAIELGLYEMGQAAFSAWAIEQAKALLIGTQTART